MREEISTRLEAEIKEEQLLEITKLQAQMKATLTELEEIRNRNVALNSKRRTNVFFSQMYSKELTLRRNDALKYRRDHFNENSDVQIKLKFPAILRYRRKGCCGK